MAEFRGIRRAWRTLLNRGQVERAVSDEMGFHLKMSAERIMDAEGLSEEEAWDEARRRFGSRPGVEAACAGMYESQRRRRAFGDVVSDTFTDLRLAGRSMRRNPGFTLISVLILGIGIGGVTLMFSVMNAVLLRPLPYPEADRLVWAWSITDRGTRNTTAALDYFDYREECDAFASLGAYHFASRGVLYSGGGEPERLISRSVSHNFFETLGIFPAVGRAFMPEEEILGSPNVIVVSHGFWQRRLGGDRGVVATALTLDGTASEVIGVMPESFNFPSGTEIWFPMQQGGGAESGRGNNNFNVIGRLADGSGIRLAQAQMELVAARIAAEFPESKEGWSVQIVPLHERLLGGLRPTLTMLLLAVAAVLAIACANLSSMLLAKVVARQGELAVRRSLGASRGAVVRQLLTETSAITLLGGLLGVGLAYAGLDLVKWLQPIASTRLQNATIDGTALVAAASITILAGFLFGVVPALKGSRVSLLTPLRDETGGTQSSQSIISRGRLVIVQVALSFVLLVIAGLLIRSLSRIQRAEVGFDTSSLLTVDVQLPVHKYAGPQEAGTAYGLIIERLNALPGVLTASGADGLPLFGGMWNGIYRPDQPPENVGDRLPALRRIAMDGYFATMGIPVLAGREFTAADRDGAQTVVVVSRKLVEALFPDEDALGKTIVHPWDNSIEMEIVGIVGDVADDGPTSDARPVFYLSFWQHVGPTARLALRTDGEPTELVPTVRAAIHEIEPDMPLTRVGTMQNWIDGNLQSSRMAVGMLSGFALIALLLVSMGLYGVLAYFVTQRTREMGIRMTLGAQPLQVVGTVLRRGLKLAGAGLVLGMAGGFVVASVIQSTLFSTSPLDPLTYLAVIGILAVIAVGASIVPAARAMRIDPVNALRNE